LPVLRPPGLWVGLQSAVLHTSEARTGAEVQNHKDDDGERREQERHQNTWDKREKREREREREKEKKQRDWTWSYIEKRNPLIIFSHRFSIDHYDARHGTDQSIPSLQHKTKRKARCTLSTQQAMEFSTHTTKKGNACIFGPMAGRVGSSARYCMSNANLLEHKTAFKFRYISLQLLCKPLRTKADYGKVTR